MELLDCLGTNPQCIDVTDLPRVYSLDSIYTRDKYFFVHNDIYIVSCDLEQLLAVQRYLGNTNKVISPEPDNESTDPFISNEYVNYRGIQVANKDENVAAFLRIYLFHDYNRRDLAKILSKPCDYLYIIGKNNDIVIRDCVFPIGKTIALSNVSLSQEARESIPHLKQLNLW